MSNLFEAEMKGFKYYWFTEKDQAEATFRTYSTYLRKFYDEYPGGISSNTSLQDARALLTQFTPSVRKMAWRAIRCFSKWCAREYDVLDPMIKLEKPAEPKPRRILGAEPDEIERLLNSIDDDDPTALRDRALILVLASSGMRRSEVARTMHADLDLVECTVFIPETKNGEPRTTCISDNAQRALMKYLHSIENSQRYGKRELPPYIWGSQVRPEAMSSGSIAQMIRRRSQKADVRLSDRPASGVALPPRTLRGAAQRSTSVSWRVGRHPPWWSATPRP